MKNSWFYIPVENAFYKKGMRQIQKNIIKYVLDSIKSE